MANLLVRPIDSEKCRFGKGDLAFHVQRPGDMCWFEIDDSDEVYEVFFSGPTWRVGGSIPSTNHGGMKTETEVRLESLGEIADALNLRDIEEED